MGREQLTRDEQEELDYIDWWWEQKEKMRLEKLERRRTRRMHLEIAGQLLGAVVAELLLIFKRK